MKIFLYYIGKPRDPHANALAADYIKRASRYSACEMRELRPGRADVWDKHSSAQHILLDPGGKLVDTAAFVGLIGKSEMEGRDLVFMVGGADGLPAEWKGRAGGLLSLSRMTLPHELARVLLAEQIYRAFATLRGHPYPR